MDCLASSLEKIIEKDAIYYKFLNKKEEGVEEIKDRGRKVLSIYNDTDLISKYPDWIKYSSDNHWIFGNTDTYIDGVVRLLSYHNLKYKDIENSLKDTIERLKDDDAVIELEDSGNWVIVGDLHGDADTLLYILYSTLNTNIDGYIFLGDYGDRGPDTWGVYGLLSTLKNNEKKLGKKVYLLRGNHEGYFAMTGMINNLKTIKEGHGEEWNNLMRELFGSLPIVLLHNNIYVHGGIVPENVLKSDTEKEDLNIIKEKDSLIKEKKDLNKIKELFKEFYSDGLSDENVPLLVEYMLWMDPGKEDGVKDTGRHTFSETTLNKFMNEKYNILIRGHQQPKEYKTSIDSWKDKDRVRLVFSAKQKDTIPYFCIRMNEEIYEWPIFKDET